MVTARRKSPKSQGVTESLSADCGGLESNVVILLNGLRGGSI
jgi:hypothetical protein